jgi:hypothetical protein
MKEVSRPKDNDGDHIIKKVVNKYDWEIKIYKI